MIDANRSHLQRGDLTDGLIFGALRIRLLKIGEVVKALSDLERATRALADSLPEQDPRRILAGHDQAHSRPKPPRP